MSSVVGYVNNEVCCVCTVAVRYRYYIRIYSCKELYKSEWRRDFQQLMDVLQASVVSTSKNIWLVRLVRDQRSSGNKVRSDSKRETTLFYQLNIRCLAK